MYRVGQRLNNQSTVIAMKVDEVEEHYLFVMHLMTYRVINRLVASRKIISDEYFLGIHRALKAFDALNQ